MNPIYSFINFSLCYYICCPGVDYMHPDLKFNYVSMKPFRSG